MATAPSANGARRSVLAKTDLLILGDCGSCCAKPPTTSTRTTPGAGASGAVKGAIIGGAIGGDAGTGAAVGAVAARSQSRRQNAAAAQQGLQQQQQAAMQQRNSKPRSGKHVRRASKVAAIPSNDKSKAM